MNFSIRVADIVFRINCIYPYLHDACADYIVPDSTSCDYELEFTEADIERERAESAELNYTSAYLEFISCQRKIADLLPQNNCFLMHGSVITWKDEAFLFTAPSGTGKSTHISLWKQYLGDDVDIVNGDKPFIRVEDDRVFCYGTPWAGKEWWQKPRKAELKGICILRQAAENSIERLTPQLALALLYPQVYFTDETGKAAMTMDMFDSLLINIPIFLLKCNISEGAVKCSFEALTGSSYTPVK